jgi:ATP-binding cassette, subfamily B, bacterial
VRHVRRRRLEGRESSNVGTDRVKPWAFLGELRRTFPYVRPYWRLLSLSGLVMALSVVASLISPWPLAILIDTVLGNKPLPALLSPLDVWSTNALLVFAVVAGVVTTGLESGLGVAGEYVNTKLELGMVQDLRSDLLWHIQRQSFPFYDERSTGNLMYVFTTEAGALGRLVVELPPLVQSVATLVGMFIITFTIDRELALLSMTVVPFIYYSTGYYTSRIEPSLMRVRNMEGEILTIAHETMSMIRVILAFGRESYHHRRFREKSEQTVDARVRLTVRQTLFSVGVTMITAVGTALVLGVGAYHVLDGTLTAGELLVVMSYIAAVYKPLEQISATTTSLQEQVVNLRLAHDVLDTEPEIRDTPDAVDLDRAAGHVTFENVDFSYKGRTQTLEDISFAAAPGQRIAIVGPTGAGKTTLVSLLPRFYDADHGRVLLDGIDIRSLKLASLRRQISVVMQEPMLFSGTIADNIRYGKLDAPLDEVIEVAKAANAHDFVTALPAGYETWLGERGAKLSGGERQRLCIARAFLENAPILVLDEPTSSIDARTEAVILDALERLIVGRTTFLIAHRLSTVRNADLVVVIDHGRIVEQGTHEELVHADGLYSQLYVAQAHEQLSSKQNQLSTVRSQLLAGLLKTLGQPDLTIQQSLDAAVSGWNNRTDSGNGAVVDGKGRDQAVPDITSEDVSRER